MEIGGPIGGMSPLQGLKKPQGTPDIEKMQEDGAKLDQMAKQLLKLIESAIASGMDPSALKALQAQLMQLQMAAESAQADSKATDLSAGGQGGGGAAALDLAKRIDDLKQQIDQLSQTAAAGASQSSQDALQQQQQQMNQSVLGQDKNQVQGRDMMSMY